MRSTLQPPRVHLQGKLTACEGHVKDLGFNAQQPSVESPPKEGRGCSPPPLLWPKFSLMWSLECIRPFDVVVFSILPPLFALSSGRNIDSVYGIVWRVAYFVGGSVLCGGRRILWGAAYFVGVSESIQCISPHCSQALLGKWVWEIPMEGAFAGGYPLNVQTRP